jgi:hypothetical protein
LMSGLCCFIHVRWQGVSTRGAKPAAM